MKTTEELNTLKEEVETVNRKLHELTEEELAQVSGGSSGQKEIWFCKYCCTATMQTWEGTGQGWDRDGNKHMCDLWVCERCECTNYRDINTGRLI